MSRPGSGQAPLKSASSQRSGAQQHQQGGGRNAVGAGAAAAASKQGGTTANAAVAAAATKGRESPATSNTAAATNILQDLKALLSQPVRLTLDDGRTEAGLLWSFDAAMDVVALEIPKAAAAPLGKAKPGFPSSAAAYPTAMLSTVKVAAQGGDAAGARTSFQLLKLRRVKQVEHLKSSSSPSIDAAAMQALTLAKITPVHRDINISAAEAREKAATAEALKRASKIGVGVSKVGQDIFDALSKTLPCRWADRHIIVMDEIVISPDAYDTATVPKIPLATLKAIAEGKQVADAPEDARGKATRWQRVSKVLEGERKRLSALA